MNNPAFDVEEDPDNANVLYLGTDYAVFITLDQGKTWTPFWMWSRTCWSSRCRPSAGRLRWERPGAV